MIPQQKSATNLQINNNYVMDNQVVVTFTCEPEDIIKIFLLVARELQFQLIEQEASYATAVKKMVKNNNLFSLINCCSWWQSDQFTAVKLLLAKQTRKGSMTTHFVAEVKGLVGEQNQIQSFLKSFKHKMSKLQVGTNQDKLILGEPEQLTFISVQNQNPYYLEACSHQIINKLILNEKYGIGKELNKMIEDFTENFRNTAESASLLPLPIKNIMSIINDVNQQLTKVLQELQYPKEILLFSKIQLEAYVFNKLEEQIYSMYRFKNVQIQNKFQHKKLKILQAYSINEMLVEVCLNKKFWSINKNKQEIILPFKQAKQEIFFTVACRELQKIVFTNSPREKIKYCQLAYTTLKNHFYDYSDRKYELTSMQDIIPVLIIIVLFLQVAELRSELDIMLDFINFEANQMQAQKRLIINLSESYNYIHRDWVLK